MRTVLGLLLILMLAATAFAVAPSITVTGGGRIHDPLDQQWGPDAFGYRAKDSNEPDGPDFLWIDIEDTGVIVNGLTDDNSVGPFPIGWNFRYYWYDVTQFWIGSNGYIKFSTPGQLAQPFPTFPNTTTPNDVLGPYVADWFFGTGDPSLCRYWTNNDDTLIVMWKDVTAWAPGGNLGDHNFELILSGADSSITFMYGTSTINDISNDDMECGFENLTGQIGINFRSGTEPPNDYAIKIAYPDTITYTVHDLAVASVQNEKSQGFFLVTGDTLWPYLAIRNAGNQTENSYVARYSIRQVSNNSLIATDDTTMGSILPSERDEIDFPALWTTTTPNLFRAVGRLTLAGDLNTGNDSVRSEVRVINLPGEMQYDDGTNDFAGGWGWNGGEGGMANEFVPPRLPIEITSVRFWVEATIPEGFEAQILDNQGDNGSPGNILWSEIVANPPGGAWSVVEVDPPVFIEVGTFFVAWMQSVEGIGFGVDSTSSQGIARRAWESAGGWAEFRYAQQADPMIRATINFAGNNAPVITGWTPTTLDTVVQNSIVTFTVTATDADGDPLDYDWFLNGNPAGGAPSVNITFTQLGQNHVLAVVSDGLDADSVSWSPWVVQGRDANDPDATIPTHFALHEAYPNPFNPTTSIAYDVAQDAQVSLRVFNLAGELVSTLVETRLQPGRYHAEWNATAQPSGTYFVTFDASGVHQVQKLLLLK